MSHDQEKVDEEKLRHIHLQLRNHIRRPDVDVKCIRARGYQDLIYCKCIHLTNNGSVTVYTDSHGHQYIHKVSVVPQHHRFSLDNPKNECEMLRMFSGDRHHRRIIRQVDSWTESITCRFEIIHSLQPHAGDELFQFVSHTYEQIQKQGEARGIRSDSKQMFMPEEDVRRLFLQIVEVLEELHLRRGYCHRDLKPSNFVIKDGCLTCIDLGAMTQDRVGNEHVEQHHRIGTLNYQAPELFTEPCQYIGSQADVYACGIILWVMLLGFQPYNLEPDRPQREHDLFQYMQTGNTRELIKRYGITNQLSPEAIDLLCEMTAPAGSRIRTQELRAHSFFGRVSGQDSDDMQDQKRDNDRENEPDHEHSPGQAGGHDTSATRPTQSRSRTHHQRSDDEMDIIGEYSEEEHKQANDPERDHPQQKTLDFDV